MRRHRIGSVNLLGTIESEQRSDGYLTYTFVAYSGAVVCTADGEEMDLWIAFQALLLGVVEGITIREDDRAIFQQYALETNAARQHCQLTRPTRRKPRAGVRGASSCLSSKDI